jgi:Xaa-Pro aminopeptidase
MKRIENFRKRMNLKAEQAALIQKPSNMYYLAGFTGEGMLLILPDEAQIFTDSRYTEQTQKEAPACKVLEIGGGKGFEHLLKEASDAHGIQEIFFEDDYVTVSGHKKMTAMLEGISFLPVQGVPEKMRFVKDEAEIAAMRQAGDISCRAFEYILGEIAPGISEKEIRLKLENKMFELGADKLAFSTIVASGPNGSLPHAVPTDRRVQAGDLITLDFGANVNHYCSDMTRTFAVGKPSAQLEEIFHIVLEAHLAAEKALAPGKKCIDIDKIARDIIEKAGYGKQFGHGLGHGVGIDIHEDPRLSPRSNDTLEVGHVVTVEPGIYLPGIGGVRIENTCLITETGSESFIWAKRDLIIL